VATADLTELVDIDPERVDGVRTPASGFPILLMKAVNASGQVNEKPDIAAAEKILRQVGQLMQAEADELAAGNPSEICDIELLTQVYHLMSCFKRGEEYNAEDLANASPAAKETPADTPVDTDKETGVPEAQNTDKTPPATEPEVSKTEVEKSAAELAEEAVAKAVEPLNEFIKELRDEMAALKSTPIPGGPVVTVPGAQRSSNEQAQHLAEATRHERLAKSVTDRELIRYHEEKAAEHRQAAKA